MGPLKRILFLDQFSEIGGAQRCLLELLPSAADGGFDAHLAVPGDGALARRLTARGITVHDLPLGNYGLGRKSIGETMRYLLERRPLSATIQGLLAREKIEAVYVNGPRLMPVLSKARSCLPVIFHTHNRVSALNGRALVARALRRTNASVIAASRYLAQQWRQPSRVVYGGVEGPPDGWLRRPAGGGPRVGVAGGGPRIGLVGRFALSKGQREFVLAAASLDRPGAEFYLCGDPLFGDRDGLRYKQEVLRLAPPSVRYLGWTEDVYDVMAGLDLLVLPSAQEGGLPNVVLEAFASGVAVLATPVGGLPEILVDGENGFLLPSPDPEMIARRLGEILAAPERIAAVASRARAQWRERFTADRFRSEIWSAVASACGL